MAIRQLIYYSKILENSINKRDLYSTEQLTILNPHFVVFYNGKAKRPAYEIQRLSDHFDIQTARPELELICGVYNINPGYNDELLKKCPTLGEYTIYVERVREGKSNGKSDKDAVNEAIDSCISDGILADFFKRRRNEVTRSTMIDMRFEVREKLIREEAHKRGIKQGLEQGSLSKSIEQICRKLKKGKNLTQIAEDLDEEIEAIRPLYDVAVKYAPDYNEEEIMNEYLAFRNKNEGQ